MSLQVKVTKRTVDGQERYEGTVSIPRLKPTKLVRSDGSTLFQSRSALTNAIKTVSESLGFTEVSLDDAVLNKAAKKTSGSKRT